MFNAGPNIDNSGMPGMGMGGMGGMGGGGCAFGLMMLVFFALFQGRGFGVNAHDSKPCGGSAAAGLDALFQFISSGNNTLSAQINANGEASQAGFMRTNDAIYGVNASLANGLNGVNNNINQSTNLTNSIVANSSGQIKDVLNSFAGATSTSFCHVGNALTGIATAMVTKGELAAFTNDVDRQFCSLANGVDKQFFALSNSMDKQFCSTNALIMSTAAAAREDALRLRIAALESDANRRDILGGVHTMLTNSNWARSSNVLANFGGESHQMPIMPQVQNSVRA